LPSRGPTGAHARRRYPRECVKAVAQLIARCKLVDARQRPSARECYDILMATPDSLCGGPGPCGVLVVLCAWQCGGRAAARIAQAPRLWLLSQ